MPGNRTILLLAVACVSAVAKSMGLEEEAPLLVDTPVGEA